MKSAEFKDRLRQAMEEKGVSATELSNRTNIGKSSISAYLKGEYMARQDKLDDIAQALGENPAWLMGFDIERNLSIIDYNIIEKEYKSQQQKHATSTELTPKDEQEIDKKIQSILSEMDSTTGLAAFGGTIEDKEEIDLIKSSLKQALAIAKKAAKEKYTPKKHRK